MRAWARLPWWGRALAIWAASRVVSTALLAAFAAAQPANAYTGASPSLVDFTTIWDARWYAHVATDGYPDELPRDASGAIADNAWAFMPVYPMLVRALVRVGLDWQIAALGIAWVASAAFAVLAHRLLRETIPRHASLALALMLFGPVSPLLQVAYAESLHLAILAGALLALRHRSWTVLVALTRPAGLAFALALGIVWAWARVRERDAWSRRDLGALAVDVSHSGACVRHARGRRRASGTVVEAVRARSGRRRPGRLAVGVLVARRRRLDHPVTIA